MKRTILASVGSVLLSVLSPAFAADMPVKGMPPAPYVAPYFNWTGFYIGINGGYGFGTSNWTNTAGTTTGNFNVNGLFVGGTLGYNYQFGAWVAGIEGDFDWSNIKGSTATACPGSCETRNNWLSTVRGRFGYAFDRWLPYITGGAAIGDIKMTDAIGSQSKIKIGWTVGGGIEWAFLPNWSSKIEYNYVDLGRTTCDAGTCGALAIDATFKTHLVRAGVNYRF